MLLNLDKEVSYRMRSTDRIRASSFNIPFLARNDKIRFSDENIIV